jgi:hypothetical protein
VRRARVELVILVMVLLQLEARKHVDGVRARWLRTVFLAGIKGAEKRRASASVFAEAMMPELSWSPRIHRITFTPHFIHASPSDFWRFQRRSRTAIELLQNLKRNLNPYKLELKALTQW